MQNKLKCYHCPQRRERLIRRLSIAVWTGMLVGWVILWLGGVGMRELKFRAWDKERKRMIPSVSFGDNKMPSNWPQWFHVTQFTGLQDKNGTDIYEGDILRHYKYGGDHAVEWHDDSTGFFVGEHSWPLTKLCCPNIEVVGNIFGPAITQP